VDRVLDALSSYTTELAYEGLPPEVVHQTKRLWIDTLGCDLGAVEAESVAIAREVASGASGARGVPMIGGGEAAVEWATFVNGMAMRYLDFNDFYQAPGVKTGGHPTDTFAPGLATAALLQRDGKALIEAAVLGWEIYANTGDAIASKELDQGLFAAIAAAAIASKMLGLKKEATSHAIAIAAVANLSVLQARYGDVAMWKSGAVPYACKNGVEAAMLASKGMTGPYEAFEGVYGVNRVSTGKFELLREFGGKDAPYRISTSSIKHFPIGSMAQTAIECALEMREEIGDISQIREVNIGTFAEAVAIMCSADKWRPQTRETADHSLPYGVAMGFLFGTVRLEHFEETFIRRPDVRDMLSKIKVRESEESTAAFPELRRSIVEVTTNDGRRLVREKSYHLGHPKNPMSDHDIEEKFRSLAEPRIGVDRARELLATIWSLETCDDARRIIGLTES
jgi:2-methylcitrate dehydratase